MPVVARGDPRALARGQRQALILPRDHPAWRSSVVRGAGVLSSDTSLPDPSTASLEHDEGAPPGARLPGLSAPRARRAGRRAHRGRPGPESLRRNRYAFSAAVAALAAAELRTAQLIAALEHAAEHRGLVVRDLMRDAMMEGSEIIGTSLAIVRLRREIDLVARSGFLRAHPRRDRHRQGTGRPRGARPRRGGTSPSSTSTAPPCPRPWPRPSCSATCAGPSPARRTTGRGSSRSPTAAPCFSTRSASCS